MGLTDVRLVRVRINGVPISGFLFSQLSSVRVTDAAGFISDTAEITFANVSPLSRFKIRKNKKMQSSTENQNTSNSQNSKVQQEDI